jgi:Single-strand binding protein family
MRYTPGGQPTTTFSVAVNRGQRGQDGQRTEETDWFRVVCWNKLAETADQYLKKGSRVYARARLALQRGGSRNRGRGIRDHRADPHWFSAIWLDRFHRTGIRASTELRLICRDAHGHQVSEFKWVEVVGYHVTKPEEKPQRD